MSPLKFWKFFLCGCVLLSLFVLRAAPAQAWTEVVSPHFRVMTDGSASQGRDVAVAFEQMRYVFVQQFKDESIGAGAPLTIVAAHDDGTFKMLEPNEWKATKGNLAGEFHRGWEKQFATVILDSFAQSSVVVLHEYTHSVLHARAHWLPIWLDEGFAEFYAYTRFEHDRTLVGAPSWRMPALHNEQLLTVSEMLETTNESKLLRDGHRANLFYAEAWAMVHYMMFGKGMENGAKLQAFFHKLQDGELQKDAFREVFGEQRAFDEGLSTYVRQLALSAAVLPADPKIDGKSFAVRKLDPAETEYELGSFQIGAHEATLGRARIEKAIQLNPKLAGAHEELAFLDFRAGKDDDAVHEWQQAVELDPSRARSVFALTMMDVSLNHQSAPQLLAAENKLQHVTELAPSFAPAYVELALIEWRLNQLQNAFRDIRKAEQLEPWRAGYHVLGGRILLAGHQPALAAKYARFVADRWSGPDHNEAVELWNAVPATDRGENAPAVALPAGTVSERGVLTELTCGNGPGVPMTLTLTPEKPGATPITFKSDGRFVVGFSDSFWWGEDHFSTCHHLAGHTAVVAYKPEDHRVLDLEVRDDMPEPVKTNAAPTN